MKARKAEKRWGLPTGTEPQAQALTEDSGFTRVALSHNKNNLFVAAVKL